VVAAALQFSPSGGVLLSAPEELLATSVEGIATFINLKIDKAAAGYVLRFSLAGISHTDTLPFSIVPSTPHTLLIDPQPGSALRGSPLSVSPQVRVWGLGVKLGFRV